MDAEQTGSAGSGWGGRLGWVLALAALAGLVIWAWSAGSGEEAEASHESPAVVEHVEGSDRAWVRLTEDAAGRIGLEVTPVRRLPGPGARVTVPYAGLIYGADGTTWVYAADDSRLGFRREVVIVDTTRGGRAVLLEGPPVGTMVAARGAAELYGSEFEVGH